MLKFQLFAAQIQTSCGSSHVNSQSQLILTSWCSYASIPICIGGLRADVCPKPTEFCAGLQSLRCFGAWFFCPLQTGKILLLLPAFCYIFALHKAVPKSPSESYQAHPPQFAGFPALCENSIKETRNPKRTQN